MAIYGKYITEASNNNLKEFNKLLDFIKSNNIIDCCNIRSNSITLSLDKVCKQTGESRRESFVTSEDYKSKIENFISNNLVKDNVILIDNFGGDWDSDTRYSFKSTNGNLCVVSAVEMCKDVDRKLSNKSGKIITGVSYTYGCIVTSQKQILEKFRQNQECAICRYTMSNKNLQSKYDSILKQVGKNYKDFEFRFANEETKDNYYKDRKGFDLVLYIKPKKFSEKTGDFVIITINDVN